MLDRIWQIQYGVGIHQKIGPNLCLTGGRGREGGHDQAHYDQRPHPLD